MVWEKEKTGNRMTDEVLGKFNKNILKRRKK